MSHSTTAPVADSWLARASSRCCNWAECWFPDAFACTVVAVALVAFAVLLHGSAPATIAVRFGEGFWSLIPFTMQMCFIIIGGYVTADSPPIARLTLRLASLPRTCRGGVTFAAVFGMLVSLLHWGLGMILSSLLVRAMATRTDIRLDYRAAAAAAYLGSGSVWAMGLSSSAAQLQANAASMPPPLLAITGVIPFSETIFTWQSMTITVALIIFSAWIAWSSAPSDAQARTAQDLDIDVSVRTQALPARTRPGEWLEYSPIPNLFIVALGCGWLWHEFATKGASNAISSLNTYNFVFFMLALLLHWRPRRFLESIARAVPGTAGILVQFPLYGGIAAMLTVATNSDGATLANTLSHVFTEFTNSNTFAFVVGIYSAVLGFFIPSGGGKWIIEAPYVMQAANDLQYHLGWTVQIYNAAEALPNLINPFWMLPVLGVLGLKARDLIGYTFVQFAAHVPLVMILLWLLGMTFTWHPPAMP
jgi:short-chain fatty acids transporter